MTVTILNIIPRKLLEATNAAQYTASGGTKVIIDAFTITNVSSGTVSFSCNLVASGDAADTDNRVISQRQIVAGETYLCPEMINQVIEASGFISTYASVANALVCSASGRVIS